MICPKKEETKDDLELQRVDTPSRKIKWTSCCFECHKDFVEYMVKYFLLFGLLVFFSIELHLSNKCESDQLYTGLLTLIIGIALPNPRLN